MSKKIRLTYNFNDSSLLEVEYKSGKWARVTANHFRSWTGKRRVNGEQYSGPIYYEGTNTKYKGSQDEKPRVLNITELNSRTSRKSTVYEEVRYYDRDEKYKKAISPNKAYL